MPAGAIFDIDGTLVDSVDLHTEAWREAFRHFGFDFPFARVWEQIGKGSDQLIPALLPPDVVKDKGKEIDEYRGRIFKRDYLPRVRPFPKVRELFERVRDGGKRIALASSAKEDELKAYISLTDVGDLIETATASGDAAKSKPHPDILQAALDRLGGMNPSAVVAVGDTPYDAEAAGKLGMRTVGVLGGGWPAERLREAGCVAVYGGPADLLRHYDSSPLK
jgi:HAD superfamily hydrolase (TIGR01509 family)